MIRTLKVLFVLSLMVVGFSLIKGENPIVQRACATLWGSCNPDPAYQICPRTGAAFGGCVDSAMFNVTINGTNIPPGQTFQIDIFPTDGSGDVCSSVTCLKRTTSFTSTGWTGSAYSVLLDQIGCATAGTCSNAYTVQVRFAQPYIDPTLNCPDPPNVLIPNIQNGVSQAANFIINCQAPVPTPTPTSTCPGTCGTFDTPQGQACTISGQNGTWQYDDQPAYSRCTDIQKPYCYICIPVPTPTATKAPTATPTVPPGVTPPTATPTPTPGICPVPGTPVVTVTCTGCTSNGTSPTPTGAFNPNPTPTPTLAVSTPTPTCSPNQGNNCGAPTPTPTQAADRLGPGAPCTINSQCASGVCIPGQGNFGGTCQ